MENYLNVVKITTFVVKMRTLIKDAYWKILEELYLNRNQPLHLREISRKIKLDQGALTRHLNKLTKDKVLKYQTEGNLKKFYINQIKNIYPIFDEQRLESLPLLRRNAIKFYIDALEEKPVFILVFGSTAKKTYKQDSDLDLIIVFNRKTDTHKAKDYAEAQTGMTISEFQLTFKEFINEIKLKKDQVIQSGLETGFPVYNNKAFYEVLYE
jgi:predicted nucleotidyltransferase